MYPFTEAVAAGIEILGVVPPELTTGAVPPTLVTDVPDDAEVILPCWSTVIVALVYVPGVTAVLARLRDPDPMIGPPVNPVPEPTEVTVPAAAIKPST
jgi:hypothetical protein